MDQRLRLRVLLALLSVSLAWLAWGAAGRASAELAAALDEQTRSARESARTAHERERRERLLRVSERLAGRAPPPTSAAGTREFLVRTAGESGVELSQLRLQPLVRPPEGTAGAEAGITALGDPDSLSPFLAAVEGTGWPLRVERATLAVRGGLGTLTASVLVLWPDPAAPVTAADAGRLGDDPRLEALAVWLESVPGPEAAVSRAAAEPMEVDPAPAVDLGVEDLLDQPPDTATLPSELRAEIPELHGFVDVGAGTPIRAALFYRGETTLVGVGDRVGDYTVVKLEPSEAVVLSRGEGPPLRLVLR
ncbi:MAG: hypothetical protein OXI45_02620 [Acidobacteriota bacterium]|nr:hypothetical protein [Acidobacteriota bacterium]MXW72509.1 hypothetical protein [Acidobacteriota bacterium]MYE44769.1 hypothetical protein [Acidobacteriota bacterium]